MPMDWRDLGVGTENEGPFFTTSHRVEATPTPTGWSDTGQPHKLPSVQAKEVEVCLLFFHHRMRRMSTSFSFPSFPLLHCLSQTPHPVLGVAWLVDHSVSGISLLLVVSVHVSLSTQPPVKSEPLQAAAPVVFPPQKAAVSPRDNTRCSEVIGLTHPARYLNIFLTGTNPVTWATTKWSTPLST